MDTPNGRKRNVEVTETLARNSKGSRVKRRLKLNYDPRPYRKETMTQEGNSSKDKIGRVMPKLAGNLTNSNQISVTSSGSRKGDLFMGSKTLEKGGDKALSLEQQQGSRGDTQPDDNSHGMTDMKYRRL